MRYKDIGTLFLAIGLLAVLSVMPSQANAAEGFYMGTGIGLSIPAQSGDVLDELDPENGLGLELIHLGYNWSNNWGIGLQYGSAVGVADDYFGDDAMWGQGYIALSGRYTFEKGANDGTFIPYVEAGLGSYVYSVISDDEDVISDPASGLRLSVGAHYYLSNIYIAPELSFHFVDYDVDAEVDPDGGSKFDVDFDETGNMLMLLVKVGYHWRK